MNINAFKNLGTRIGTRLRRRWYSPRLVGEVSNRGIDIITLGTKYGGWSFVSNETLRNGWAMLCGAGEDISFDLALQQKYDCNIIIVDPTPLAIRHFDLVKQSALTGKRAAIDNSGVDFYDVEGVDFAKIHYVPVATWIERTTVKFWTPRDGTHVSHSITNLQNTAQYINVMAETISETLERFALSENEVSLLKLDIEGAEIRVIDWMCENSFLPRQILVEFDALFYPDNRTKSEVQRAIRQLRRAGYRLVYFNGQANCAFLR
ncbi:MAG: FkbM family methyltransferase, partial [Candidatus Acidiferrum sp.]